MTQGVRVTGGKWRGRKISCVADNVRPTTGWARESLFAWLGRCDGYHVLDLAAGTGILSFEALSRGATEALCCDIQKDVLTQIENVAANLNTAILTQHLDLATLQKDAFECNQFDIVFFDPPYDVNWREKALDCIANSGWLRERGFIYYESSQPGPHQVGNMSLCRQKKRGGVCLNLYQILK